MGRRTIRGNLAADPEQRPEHSDAVTTFVVVERTGRYVRGEPVWHDVPTTHHVEARSTLGRLAARTLRQGHGVTVTGKEHTETWEVDGRTEPRRVIEATTIAVDLALGQEITVELRRPEGALEADWPVFDE